MTTDYLPITNRAEWLAARAKDITSTETAALFNLSPYETHFELWHRKHSGDASEIDDNDRMQAGRHIEPAIASLVSERYGVHCEPMKTYATDRQRRMGSSFDFKIDDLKTMQGGEHTVSELSRMYLQFGDGILECKNVDYLAYRDKWTDTDAPDHIEIQLQHQLEVTGMPWGCIACLVGGNTLRLIIRQRDAAMGRAIRERVKLFWESIDANRPPSPVLPDDAEAVIALHQYANPDELPYDGRDNESLLSAARRYVELGRQITEAETERDSIKASVLLEIQEHPKLVLDGGFSISASLVKDTPPTLITADMVGKTYGGRKGFRMFRVNAPKTKET